MIKNTRYMPVTEISHPFARAAVKCKFDEIGYAEDEYLVYGTANLYDADENEQVHVIHADAEYVNRVLIRRPTDFSKFSGNVVVEILNATARMDIDRMWVNSWKYFTRNGDIYIGLTSKSDVLQSFYDFDIERYGDLNWTNPMPDREPPAMPAATPFKFDGRYEPGLFWDMLTDYAKLLRSECEMNPLRPYGKFKLYLTGWSQSTGYINRYIKSFAYLPVNCANGPLFDGYLSAGGGVQLAPINAYKTFGFGGARRRRSVFGSDGAGIMGAREPFIAVNTESENTGVNWKGDSDMPGSLFRIYEFPGSSHDSNNNLMIWYKDDPDTDKIGITPEYHGTDGEPNDYPYEVLFNAAFRNLYNWVRTGVPAPHGDRIPLIDANDDMSDAFGLGGGRKNVTDAFGNAIGGIRTAAIDYPTVRYYSYSTMKDGRRHGLFGHIERFSPEFLCELYGSLEKYRALVKAHTYAQVLKGFIIAEEADAFVDELVAAAAARGLK